MNPEAEAEFNALPGSVRSLCMFYMQGGFGAHAKDWLEMFNEYVELRRAMQPIPFVITEAGRKHLESNGGIKMRRRKGMPT